MNQFYITLPSNSSMNIYPENKISSFKVSLPETLNIDSEHWEVALSEIQFPHTWYNIRQGKNEIVKEYFNLTENELSHFYPVASNSNLNRKPKKQLHTYKEYVHIHEGYYDTIEKLIKALKLHEAEEYRPVRYVYNALLRRTSIVLPENCKLYFGNSDVGYCLGFNPNAVVSESMTSLFLSDVKRYDLLYVYTDIIRNQAAGDVKAPLLRVVPVKSKYGEMECINYEQSHFLPLCRSSIQTIEINIKDETYFIRVWEVIGNTCL